MVIIVKYGLYHEIEKRKMEFAEPGDTVVLIQNGVFWLLNNKVRKFVPESVKVCALKDDFLARGYDESDTSEKLISYDEFIEILEKDGKTIS